LKTKTLKLKINLPHDASIYAEKGDKANDLLLYEMDQLEVLEEVIIDHDKANFKVKDGQYVNKGDIIFTEGLLGHKAMVCDVAGIIEIQGNKCRILGQKRHFERRINLNAEVSRLVPKNFIELSCNTTKAQGCFYVNFKTKITTYLYINDKKNINPGSIDISDPDLTLFINDNLYIDDLAKIVAFGFKRIIVNGLYINDLESLKHEIAKLDSFCILSGFGEIIAKRFEIKNPLQDLIWGKKALYFSDSLSFEEPRIFEHPFWGMSGKIQKKNNVTVELNYNGEVFESYLKNLEKNG
jgi:hypothetical protein